MKEKESTKRTALYGILIALAMVLSFVETLLPVPMPVRGRCPMFPEAGTSTVIWNMPWGRGQILLCFVVCEPFETNSEQIDEIGHNHGFHRGAPGNLYICL